MTTATCSAALGPLSSALTSPSSGRAAASAKAARMATRMASSRKRLRRQRFSTRSTLLSSSSMAAKARGLGLRRWIRWMMIGTAAAASAPSMMGLRKFIGRSLARWRGPWRSR
jgi:hypothetical protein